MDRPRELSEEPDHPHRPLEAPEPASLPNPTSFDGDRGYEPVHPRSGSSRSPAEALRAAPRVGFLIVKYGALLFKLKVFTTAASMLVSIAAYAWIWGLPFAIGFVVLIFVHELGHVLELRRQGVPASAPLFIPFLGAVIGMKQLPDDAWKEARVALAGPDPRVGRGGGLLARCGGEWLGAPHGARVRRLLPQPVQPDPDRAARRRAGGRCAPSGDLARRPADDGRPRGREPEPDPDHHRHPRRARALAALAGAWREGRVLPRSRCGSGSRSPSCTSA